MKKVLLAILIGGVILFSGCTEQHKAKTFGGSYTIDLPADKKLINITWKETNIWYLVRDMRPDEQPENYIFQESSNYGLVEGQIIIKEWKSVK